MPGKNKKFFVVSGVHGFFTILKETLNEAGWQQDNPNHILIVAGDLFDRGKEAVELLDFVQSLGDRFIYVRGNHEDLLEACVQQLNSGEDIDGCHLSNGTIGTISDFCHANANSIRLNVQDTMRPIVEWINNKTVDYVELHDYIIVHGWIPTISLPDKYSFDINWNKQPSSREEKEEFHEKWIRARWLNGMECWKQGIIVPNKTIICGHYHCSWGWSHIRQKYKEFPQRNNKNFTKSFQPFVDEGIIALDACTAYSGLMNLVVIENGSLTYVQGGMGLK